MDRWKRALLWSIVGMIVLQYSAASGESVKEAQSMGGARANRIRLSFDGKETIVRVDDHPTTRDFLSRLPLKLNFQDYIGKEKIAHLSHKLSSDGSSARSSGDFAYYAPWGNIAIFYNGIGNAGGGLIVLGEIESGKSSLAAMNADFTMTLERVE